MLLIEQVTEMLAYDQQVAAFVLIDKTVEDLVCPYHSRLLVGLNSDIKRLDNVWEFLRNFLYNSYEE